jgi:hypothetical protein
MDAAALASLIKVAATSESGKAASTFPVIQMLITDSTPPAQDTTGE